MTGLMKTVLGICLISTSQILIAQIYDQSLWQAHLNSGDEIEFSLSQSITVILKKNKVFAAQSFLSKSIQRKEEIYQLILQDEDYNRLFRPRQIQTFNDFVITMESLSYPSSSRSSVLAGNMDEYILQAYLFKRLNNEMNGNSPQTFSDSIRNVNLEQYRESVAYVEEMARGVCSGDFGALNSNRLVELVGNYTPRSLISFGTRVYAGASCHTLVDDIIELTSPYASPITSGHSAIEATSLYLVKKLIPNTYYRSRDQYYDKLLQASRLRAIPTGDTPYSYFSRELGLNALQTMRLIALTNHNHGLEFFAINAIIDMTPHQRLVVERVREFYEALNRLYFLVESHYRYRGQLLSRDPYNRASRRYHFWGTAWLTCELVQKNYWPSQAKRVATRLGLAYEHLTTDGDDGLDEESEMDARMHELGADFGGDICPERLSRQGINW